jgi:protoheme IX farnesyltransferase
MLAPKVASYDWTMILILTFAGLCITGSANAINQAVEKDTDAQMKRTANRPVASGRMSQQHAYLFALITGIVGIALMWYYFNLSSALVSAFSLFLYAFIYTPLKKVNSIAVLVGAFPGALPCLIGWVAGNDDFSFAGWSLFLVQFLWQFPHFWAIAWVSDEDYKRAGFKLLPSGGGQDLNTAIQIMIYTLFLLPLGLLPSYFGLTGLNSGIVATICGVLFLAQTFSLMRDCSRKSALKIMFGSFLYLPIVQIAYLLDKVQ